MEKLTELLQVVGSGFGELFQGLMGFFTTGNGLSDMYTAAARWVFILLAAFILLKSIFSLLNSVSPAEVWAYLHLEGGKRKNIPITHWENAIGRAGNCDIRVDHMSVSRNHGTLNRDAEGKWSYMDLGSRNGAKVNGRKVREYEPVEVKAGDEMMLGAVRCELFPVSMEERMNNVQIRKEDTKLLSPWSSFIALTIFQIMTVIQLKFGMGERYTENITIAFAGLTVLMWTYFFVLRSMNRKGFEIETIAFFLSTLSLAVMATALPKQIFTQFLAIVLGVIGFFLICTYLRDLDRVKNTKMFLYLAAAALLVFNLLFATTKNGASNWVIIGPFSIQPSEIVKIAYVCVGAATMNELFRRMDSLIFTGFSAFCFACLALMGDFGTAIIFFVTFLIISFLRSGDFTKLILVLGVAFVAGLMVLRFKSHVAARFDTWGHIWELMDGAGYQQTRMLTAASSGGFVGLGAGEGWLGKSVYASWADLVFGVLTEEWGLIIAILCVLSIITLAVFAFRQIWAGRSTFYTIAACAATSIFLTQTILNVLGSLDIIPFTGVTFPFLSAGGSSMIASWGLLAFLKGADTRQDASIAVKNDTHRFSDSIRDDEPKRQEAAPPKHGPEAAKKAAASAADENKGGGSR